MPTRSFSFLEDFSVVPDFPLLDTANRAAVGLVTVLQGQASSSREMSFTFASTLARVLWFVLCVRPTFDALSKGVASGISRCSNSVLFISKPFCITTPEGGEQRQLFRVSSEVFSTSTLSREVSSNELLSTWSLWLKTSWLNFTDFFERLLVADKCQVSRPHKSIFPSEFDFRKHDSVAGCLWTFLLSTECFCLEVHFSLLFAVIHFGSGGLLATWKKNIDGVIKERITGMYNIHV